MVALLASPHLDDASFSCGGWPAINSGTVVCAEFAPTPESIRGTTWDRQHSFARSNEAIRGRISQNSAMSLLHAVPCQFPLESQYEAPASADSVLCAMLEVIDEHAVEALMMPVGLYHSDHKLVRRACRRALKVGRDLDYGMYEHALYRRMAGLMQTRLGQQLESWRIVDTDPCRRARF
jgi:hypothetical protein